MMNIGNYGQTLARLGVQSMAQPAELEANRRDFNAELAQKNQAAMGQGVGTLLGAAVGAGTGIVDERARQFDVAHADEQKQWDKGSKDYQATHVRPEYSALSDLQDLFKGWLA